MKAAVFLVLTLLVSGCATLAPAPPNAVFVATLQGETLTPRWDISRCDETFSHAGHAPQPDEVCISNSCGWSEARLRVTEPLVGSVATRVRLRASLGEWCRPLFFGQHPDPMLIVTGAPDSRVAGVRFEVYELFEVGPDELAFVPPAKGSSLLAAKLPTARLDALLKPIPPHVFQSRAGLAEERLRFLLQLPYVCTQGNDLAYCKAIFLPDFKNAMFLQQ